MANHPPTLNPALSDFWLTPARNRVLYGGRSSSKSWDAAGFAIFLAQHCRLRFLCTRQFQNRIEESVYTLLIVQIERFGLRDQFTIIKNKIVHKFTGTEFIFYGLWRNIEEIKSLEGVDIHWSEEAHLLSEEQWRIINPTLRNEGSQHWIIFNPRFVTDFVWKKFVVDPPADTIVREINYPENPFLSETILKIINELKEKDYDEYCHVYLGKPLSDDDKTIIKRKWLEACIDAHKKLGIQPEGVKRIGYDVADDGPDMNATTAVHGIVTVAVDEWKGGTDELMKSCKRVHLAAKIMHADIWYDGIGVGAGCGSNFQEINKDQGTRLIFKSFIAGNKVHKPDSKYIHDILNKDFFSNIKAQAWWLVADRCRTTYNAVVNGQQFEEDELISISSDVNHLDKLIDELCTPFKDFDKAGRVKVEDKDDLDKRGIASPNLADSFIIAYNPKIQSLVNYGDLL